MAELEKLIPHILTWEIGLYERERALPTPRKMYESVARRGFHNKQNDLGGATMVGVTLQTYREYCRQQGQQIPGVEQLKRLGYNDWLSILKGMFWDPVRADEIRNQSLAEMLVDWRWVNGVAAVKRAQRTLGLIPDGIIGPKSLQVLNSGEAKEKFAKLQEARRQSYCDIVKSNPSQKIHLQGWINRTNALNFRED